MVLGPRQDTPVSEFEGARNAVLMARKHGHLRSSLHVPDAQRAIVGPRENAPVPEEKSAQDRFFVTCEHRAL